MADDLREPTPMRKPTITLPEPGTEPHPTKVAVFSTEDIPRHKPVVGALLELAGIPAIVAVDGVVMRMQVSEWVQPGWVLVFDEAIFTAAITAEES